MAEGGEEAEEILALDTELPWVVCIPTCCPELPSWGRPCPKLTPHKEEQGSPFCPSRGIHWGSRQAGNTDLPPLRGSPLFLLGPFFFPSFLMRDICRHNLSSPRLSLPSLDLHSPYCESHTIDACVHCSRTALCSFRRSIVLNCLLMSHNLGDGEDLLLCGPKLKYVDIDRAYIKDFFNSNNVRTS